MAPQADPGHGEAEQQIYKNTRFQPQIGGSGTGILFLKVSPRHHHIIPTTYVMLTP